MGEDTSTVIEAVSVTKNLPGPQGELAILRGIDLAVVAGESVAIVGTSGCGKSTLLGLLAGLDNPSDGQIRLLGQALDGLNEDGRAALRAGRVGFVFQTFELVAGLSALENVMLALELAGRRRTARAEAQAALVEVGLGDRCRHTPAQLSGGEQQRVAIARAFATRPAVLFADEPTGNLDQATGAKIADLLFAQRQAYQTTLILVTHDPLLARRCRDRLLLDNGRLVPL